MDLFQGIDWGCYYFFRFQALEHRQLVTVMSIFAEMGSVTVTSILVLAALLVSLGLQHWRQILIIIAIFSLAHGLLYASQTAIPRQRPEDAPVSAAEMSQSFPARGVLLFTTAILLLLQASESAMSRRVFSISVVAVALLIVGVALSQFVLRLHFLTDVLGGLFGGFALALLARALMPAHRFARETMNQERHS